MSRLSEGVEVDPDCADGHGILEQSDPTWRHVTWHDIKPYTRYRFKARAHNLLGWSEWSDIVERRTKVAIPDIPGAPFSIATTPTCIVLSWKEPSGNGLPVLDYLIHWSREGVGRVWTGWRRFRIVPGAHVRIESLASDRGYKFRVNARNEMGSSNFSESSAVIVTYQAIDIVDIKSTSIEISWKNLGYCSSPDVDRFEMQVMDCLHKKWITTSDELRGNVIVSIDGGFLLFFSLYLSYSHSLTYSYTHTHTRYLRTSFETTTKSTLPSSNTTTFQGKRMERLVRLCCNGTRENTLILTITS